jgi:hypothetical protein
MAQTQEYLDHLLSSIEKKRLLSIKELNKTDLNTDTELDDVSAWYLEIISMVQQQPPKFYVRCVTVVEDEMGKIRRVDYEYFDSDENPIYDTSFLIVTNP